MIDVELIQEIKQDLKDKKIKLSYSTLKHLNSPINFMGYLLQRKKEKLGLVSKSASKSSLGTMVDVLLLNPDKFNDSFSVLKHTPSSTSDNQKGLCEEVIKSLLQDKLNNKDLSISLAESYIASCFSNHYARGKADAKVLCLAQYCIDMVKGKEIVNNSTYLSAYQIAENLKTKEEIIVYLEQAETIKDFTFNYKSWEIIVKMDIFNNNDELKGVTDLKFVSNLVPDKFIFDIIKYGYDIQIGMYGLAEREILGRLGYFNYILYDDKGNYSIPTIDTDYQKWCIRKVDYLIDTLELIIKDDKFNKSFDFMGKTIITKPKFGKGLDFSIFEEGEEYDHLKGIE